MSMKRKQNHIIISDKAKCCGCTACYSACPKKAIDMCEDEEGFQYPKVQKDMCVDCGICIQKCPIQMGNLAGKTETFLAVKHKREEIRAQSASGGMFSALAEGCIARGGVVYGAALDAEFSVRHIRTTGQEWIKLRSSKYAQSDMGDAFSKVKEDLKNGKEVLFTGTPCQIDGLNRYLTGVNTEKLLTVDLICHGVPSLKVWRDYLEFVKKTYHEEIGKVNFRNKTECGWHGSTLRIENKSGKILVDESKSESFFFKLFNGGAVLRPSCFSCQYANLNRVGDITIGDYWGVEDSYPELDDDKGLSLVMANTPKGRKAIEAVADICEMIAVSEEKCLQPQLKKPVGKCAGRETFWWTYRTFGLEVAGKRACYLPVGRRDKVRLLFVKVLDKTRKILKIKAD